VRLPLLSAGSLHATRQKATTEATDASSVPNRMRPSESTRLPGVATRVPAAIAPLGRLLQFLASGVPGFILSVSVNSFLVVWLKWPKPLSYLIALMMQTMVNFYLCPRLAFGTGNSDSPVRQFFQFLAGVAGFRIADWLVYVLLVEFVHLHFLAAQLLNIAMQSVPKYKFAQAVFRRKGR